ncbi:MAG TPA: HAD family hydrolase [Pyrinomonadaceae bacterium]|jgi:HAD superfamily hydrolase (TIGR01549 family)
MMKKGNKARIQAVIFDIDGTLIDSNAAHAESFAGAFKKFGKDVPAGELKCLIGMGADDILKKYLSGDEIEKIGEDLKEYRKKVFLEKYLPNLKVFPKTRELFEKLKQDDRQPALGSSASEEELKEYKKLLDIDEFIEEETNADDADEAKPEPDIFLAAFDKLKNVDKENVLVIGDTPYDAEAASKADLKIFGVESGGWTREKLLETGCAEVFRNVAEIYENYEKIFT